MKRFIIYAIAATSLAACNNQKETEVTSTADTTTLGTTSVDTSVNKSTTTTYTPAEGDVMYRDGKLMVWRNNAYVAADNDVTVENGIVVKRNGEVVRDGNVVRLEDGQAVTRTGRFFDRAGLAIENAWDATKRGAGKAADATKKGVNEAADAIKKGANKVGDKVSDAVH